MAFFKKKTAYIQYIDEDAPEYQQFLQERNATHKKRVTRILLILL